MTFCILINSIIERLGLLITQEGWNSIYSLFCMLMLFPVLFVLPVHFPSLFSQKKKIPFIIIKHELCFPPSHILLMKYSAYNQEIFASLYFLSYEYVCTNYLIFLYICSAL